MISEARRAEASDRVRAASWIDCRSDRESRTKGSLIQVATQARSTIPTREGRRRSRWNRMETRLGEPENPNQVGSRANSKEKSKGKASDEGDNSGGVTVSRTSQRQRHLPKQA